MEIKHVVVLMLENRSFDSMLGTLYPASAAFDGLTGTEQNTWHNPDGSPPEAVRVWTSAKMTPDATSIPTPDPGELFTDVHTQIHGMVDGVTLNPEPTMDGFVDNYMRQPAADAPYDMAAVMHYYTATEIPVLTSLARQFAVSDRWHASAPCQTWPNRFFAHTGTANGYVNNAPTHFPYLMETVFNRLHDDAQVPWKIYFHDIPQAVTLTRLWGNLATNFRHFDDDFKRDAASGNLPAYSFIEPRYFTDTINQKMPNDQHPPHNVSHGEALIAAVYNAVRGGSGWKNTLLIITYDEHGGCYDHVVPPAAASPQTQWPPAATPQMQRSPVASSQTHHLAAISPQELRSPAVASPTQETADGFDFGYFGVRVPAVIVSPWVHKGSVIRPPGSTPFDHTSIIATLRKLFPFAPLTPRDAAAPDLLDALTGDGNNDGPAFIAVEESMPTTEQIAHAASLPPNGMQHALNATALRLPTAGADIGAHIQRLTATTDPTPTHPSVKSAAEDITAHIKAFLGWA